MNEPSALSISCLCGAAKQVVHTAVGDQTADQLLVWPLCHCNTCRHITGVLCTSYSPIQRPESVAELERIDVVPHSSRYFCRTCGCHVFRWRRAQDSWEVATGVIVNSLAAEIEKHPRVQPLAAGFAHLHTGDTIDGGLSSWLPGSASSTAHGAEKKGSQTATSGNDQEHLDASCHCGNVRLCITRPSKVSTTAKSQFPDLMMAYGSTDPAVMSNPNDVKWWLRADSTKYLAGTCACRSCRLMSGFEVQTWAFVPRANLFIDTAPDRTSLPENMTALDFHTLPEGILRSFESSPGVVREFCGRCGATVFWHDKWRPELMDVSVGLLNAVEGARASNWLEWWTERVSFAEDARTQRTGFIADRAEELVTALAEGLMRSREGPLRAG